MLAQKQREIPYIAVFKLGSGEEFVGKVVDETMLGYLVMKPLCMVGTESGLRFAPLIMMGDPEEAVSIPKPVIAATPAPQLEEQYLQATSSIALPKRGVM